MRKVELSNEQYYHVYNRGVDRRVTFTQKNDYQRFLYLLHACNDTQPILNSQFYYRGLASIEKRNRETIVDILSFCLMPNHFHLLLRQRADNGISRFMQKLGTGYTMYFNTKYQRSGSLFQGTFKAIHIDEETYLTHLTRYIHLNPLELKEPDWKEKGVKNWNESYKFVQSYPWSSFSDYIGQKRFGSILNKEVMDELYDRTQYESFTKEWAVKDLNLIRGYIDPL